MVGERPQLDNRRVTSNSRVLGERKEDWRILGDSQSIIRLSSRS